MRSASGFAGTKAGRKTLVGTKRLRLARLDTPRQLSVLDRGRALNGEHTGTRQCGGTRDHDRAATPVSAGVRGLSQARLVSPRCENATHGSDRPGSQRVLRGRRRVGVVGAGVGCVSSGSAAAARIPSVAPRTRASPRVASYDRRRCARRMRRFCRSKITAKSFSHAVPTIGTIACGEN
jgi:hypothetical protein